MNKILKKISACLVAIVCVLGCFGCSCERQLSVKYSAKVERENSFENFSDQLLVGALVEKKFREPANTPCYEKVDGEMVLVKDANVRTCYDETGKNKFERATIGYVEKVELERNVMISTVNGKDQRSFTSKGTKTSEKYSLIYTIEIRNNESSKSIYIKKDKLTIESIFGDQLKQEAIDNGKVSMYIENQSSVTEEDGYYNLKSTHSLTYNNSYIVLVITVKNVTNKDLKDSRNKTLNLNLDVIVK